MKTFEGRFAGRTTVVTGGASGLGRDVARRIVAEGGRVSIWDVNIDLVAEVANEIVQRTSPFSTLPIIALSQKRLCRRTRRSAGSTCW
jgi:NAD(P)-dependent dehydrogenase (short-subunit alcohol dehydrogenase family)